MVVIVWSSTYAKFITSPITTTTPAIETVTSEAEEEPLESPTALATSPATELAVLPALSSRLPALPAAPPAVLDTVSTAPSTQLPVAFAAASAALETVSTAPLTQLPVASTAGDAALATVLAASVTALPAVLAAEVTSLMTLATATFSVDATAAIAAMAMQERKRVILRGGTMISHES
ncbi:hypothetical protein PF008_g2059 [Phytophthora fragariae]|uniref:Uncharacterized protein n=1 Tax=Phytophthora fragariae TaxID=53985 RepID=A0A6G0SI82_9STRA|nr:hypothetical protein PF008_g2059 [Phytophthora fragariae]